MPVMGGEKRGAVSHQGKEDNVRCMKNGVEDRS
jgi:hypothetical protein